MNKSEADWKWISAKKLIFENVYISIMLDSIDFSTHGYICIDYIMINRCNYDIRARNKLVKVNNKEENCLEHNMIHVSLKPNIFFKLFKVIVTEKYDVKTIKQKILFDNDWAWKTCVYGFVGDIENILMLKKSIRH